jgi:TPR repeat protein
MFKIGLKLQQEKKYEDMKKTYLDAIKQENSTSSMHNLAHHYYNVEKNVDDAIKYLIMGVDKKCMKCAYLLGEIYDKENNEKLAKKYYKLAIQYGYCREYYEHNDMCKRDHYNDAMNDICIEYFLEGREYERRQNTDLAIKYYKKSLKYGNCDFHPKRTLLYLDLAEKAKEKRLKAIFKMIV